MVVKCEEANKNGFRFDVQGAVAAFLAAKEGFSLTLFPQAVNPFIRSLESMGVWGQSLIFPVVKKKGSNKESNYKPLYMIVKVKEHFEDETVNIEWE